MAELGNMSGCGVFSAVFGRRPRRSVSTGSLPNVDVLEFPKTTSSRGSDTRRRKGSHGSSIDYSSSTVEQPENKTDRIIPRPTPNQKRKAIPPVYVQSQQTDKKSVPDVKVGSGGSKVRPSGQHFQNDGANKKVAQGMMRSGELEAMIEDHQRSNYNGNMKVFGNLGNLRQMNPNNVNYIPKNVQIERPVPNGMGNITRPQAKANPYCRALSTRMDPEQLKIMGNEDYKNGRFAEALSLYDAAISLDPEKASYRSNKSAALTSLGRLLEAVFEAKEAIRIEPFYQRAHNRLATLYLRLGEPEKTICHYKQAGSEAEPDLITKAQNLQMHLTKCNEAKKRRDWNRLLKETSLAISSGADFALQIYTMKAEGLLKLHRHQEANQVLSSAPKFDVDDCTKFYGPIIHASILVIRAQVYLAAGRIDDAMEEVQTAAKMDPNNKDANIMVHRTKAIIDARFKGNDLFKAAKYLEACNAYGEGLDHEPFNSVLLCNRAACRAKLGQFEKAIEDCTMALNIRPSYSKARLRRADCSAKLGKWQASIDDYEMLTRESPEDEAVRKSLKEAKDQLNRA
uniref:TPR repeat-containing thioredoxin TTL4-like n=1 Tax=Erigeron canadensis TaxID=72917 RepID=UPI001CB8B946|nr:TPR repeat-containing thioredoxin TTL4-like [Erigeron canadensis]